MRRYGWHFLALIFAVQTITLCAQTAERPKPWFSLSIEASDPSHPPTHYTADRQVVMVTLTNISDVDETYLCNMEPECGLDMHVLMDGAPAEETEGMRVEREIRHPTKPARQVNGVSAPQWEGSVQAPHTFKPGKGTTFPLAIADYFDMTKPGMYTITVSKETFPDNPEKSVTVWSNTITMIISRPEVVAPK
jgi:hypothetical protein